MTATYDFTGQTAVVTGGTRGIGRGVATAFIEAGAVVIATYAGNESAAAAFATELGPLSERLKLERFDVSDYDAVESFYRRLEEEYETLEVLVNNAGIRRDSVVGMMPPEDWQRVVDVNLKGTFAMSKFAVHKMMQARYGRIITVTSPSGRIGFAGQANYAATKAGQVAFTRSLAREVAKRGITVNCVSPGFIDTDFIGDLPEEQRQEYRGMIPVRRFGKPADVANAVLFLAARGTAYVTGATLEVTGGL